MSEPVRILFVDDEKNILRSIERLLLDEPYEVLTATSGEEGLAALEASSPIRIVVSDYRMPGMNGVQFLREVRKRWPETVRIVLSGYADTASVISSINEGHVYKFIAKPWNEDELKITIVNGLERFELWRKNRELTDELRARNEELTLLNRHLEARVAERAEALMAQNRLLTESLGILDRLPMAVVGMDPAGTVFQCNRKGMVCFGNRIGPVIGANRRDVLTETQNRLVDEVLEESRRAEGESVERSDGSHRVLFERDPYAADCLILIVGQGQTGG